MYLRIILLCQWFEQSNAQMVLTTPYQLNSEGIDILLFNSTIKWQCADILLNITSSFTEPYLHRSGIIMLQRPWKCVLQTVLSSLLRVYNDPYPYSVHTGGVPHPAVQGTDWPQHAREHQIHHWQVGWPSTVLCINMSSSLSNHIIDN